MMKGEGATATLLIPQLKKDVSGMQPFNAEQLAQLNASGRGTMQEALSMTITAVSAEGITVQMVVTDAARQPYGIVHGGAMVALCETAASIGTALGVDPTKYYAVGLEINANHLRPTRAGTLTATATPLHRGRTTWVWDIRVHNDEGKLTAISRCTVAVVPIERDGAAVLA
jgi:1,4-dihydroxy-2-naphthoyl-CoA hydrolase